jgi:hypothetical protein
MAVTIPPWLQIDPIEPARILQRSSAQRAQNAAAARRAQLEEQRMYMQEQMMYARLAAQERADQRREQVLRETRDSQLAQQAAALEFRREMGLRQNARQMQQLRLREQQQEQKTASAARQLLGMRRLQEKLTKGVPLAQALSEESGDLFAEHPERLASALRAARPPKEAAELGPEAYTAREIIDAQGQPMGLSAIPGKGSARLLPGARGLRPGERVNALKALIALTQNKIDFEAKKDEKPALIKKRDAYEKDLETLTMQMGAPMERLPGKEDERMAPEGEEGDFGLPPVDMGEEEASLEGDLGEDEEMSDEFAEEEPEPEEDEMALEEDF